MALLDGFDDTTKDEFGMTQAERQRPLWSGLIRAGLLGVAAGGENMPAQRNQMIAQMGGAIGDIPSEMMQYRAGAAQQALRGQQVAAGKTKLANIAKMQAIAKTPEFLDSIKDLKPHQKIAMQAAIDAGDIDAFAKVTGHIDTADQATARLDIARRNAETAEASLAQRAGNQAEQRRLEEERNALNREKKEQSEGQMTPAKAWGVINRAAAAKDPNDPIFASPEYKHARQLLEKPSVVTNPDGQKLDVPGEDFSHLPPPTFNMTGDQPKPRTPTVLPGQPPKSLDKDERETVGKHVTTLQTMDNIDDAIAKNPNMKLGNTAAGLAASVTDPALVSSVLNKVDPSGQATRANIADIRSQTILDRSGKAVTLGEMKQLTDFIPTIYDDAPIVQKKLTELRRRVNQETKIYYENLKNKNALIPTDLAARVRTIGKGGATIPQAHIAYLEENPTVEAIKDFDEKYGSGASNRVLGR